MNVEKTKELPVSELLLRESARPPPSSRLVYHLLKSQSLHPHLRQKESNPPIISLFS